MCEARVKHRELEKIDAGPDANAMLATLISSKWIFYMSICIPAHQCLYPMMYSFDLQLEKFGIDLDNLKESATTLIYYAWCMGEELGERTVEA